MNHLIWKRLFTFVQAKAIKNQNLKKYLKKAMIDDLFEDFLIRL